jgi:predicted metal-dependent peptidase
MKNHINYHNKVEKDSIIWANAAITAIINNMIINLDKHVHNSEYEKESMKFLEYIRISEKQGRTKKQISANFRKFPKKTRDVILNDLIDQEKITKSENNKYYCI